ncbi:MAG: hypothetical protein WCK67_10025 [bacterium]
MSIKIETSKVENKTKLTNNNASTNKTNQQASVFTSQTNKTEDIKPKIQLEGLENKGPSKNPIVGFFEKLTGKEETVDDLRAKYRQEKVSKALNNIAKNNPEYKEIIKNDTFIVKKEDMKGKGAYANSAKKEIVLGKSTVKNENFLESVLVHELEHRRKSGDPSIQEEAAAFSKECKYEKEHNIQTYQMDGYCKAYEKGGVNSLKTKIRDSYKNSDGYKDQNGKLIEFGHSRKKIEPELADARVSESGPYESLILNKSITYNTSDGMSIPWTLKNEKSTKNYGDEYWYSQTSPDEKNKPVYDEKKSAWIMNPDEKTTISAKVLDNGGRIVQTEKNSEFVTSTFNANGKLLKKEKKQVI